MGVFIKPGLRIVRMSYEPALTSLWVQFAGMLLCAAAALQLVIFKPRAA